MQDKTNKGSYKTPYKYRYTLGSDAERTSDGKYIIYHRGERKEIETSSVEFWGDLSNPEPMTRVEFDEVTKDTKGIVAVYGIFADDVIDNKYYTPKIEEFHVGFEYERINTYKSSVNTLEKHTLTFEDFKDLKVDDGTLCGPEGKGDVLQVRVKYLDKEDIESLGFKFINKGEKLKNDSVYTIDAYEKGYFSPADNYTILTIYDSGFCHIYSNVNWVGDPSAMSTVFIGKIKNKSELKRLLIQLGIDE